LKKQEVEFHSGSLILRGEFYLPDRKPAPPILVCHAMHAEGFRWLPLYRLFAEEACGRGFACLLFDFRGCGRSEGEFDYGWREQEDARAAFESLLGRQDVNSERAFVVGRSLGGTVALHSLMRDPRAKGFALWATPPDHHRNVRNFITKRYGSIRYLLFFILSYIDRFHDVTGAMKIELFGLKLRLKDLRWKLMALNNAQLLSEIGHPPILLLIGDKDEYVTLREAQDFEKSISGKGRLVVFKTGHTFKGAEESIISLTLEWFEELLKSQLQDAQV
jgi:alpha/beta superfamily hydrolase